MRRFQYIRTIVCVLEHGPRDDLEKRKDYNCIQQLFHFSSVTWCMPLPHRRTERGFQQKEGLLQIFAKARAKDEFSSDDSSFRLGWLVSKSILYSISSFSNSHAAIVIVEAHMLYIHPHTKHQLLNTCGCATRSETGTIDQCIRCNSVAKRVYWE